MPAARGFKARQGTEPTPVKSNRRHRKADPAAEAQNTGAREKTHVTARFGKSQDRAAARLLRERRHRRRRRFGRKPNPNATSTANETGPGLAHERKAETPTSKSGNSPRRKIRPATPTNHLDQDQRQEHKKNLRFGTNTNKMQTRNISLRSEPNLHPIHGGLRPPSLF
jgi:hypothetical protein